MSWHAPGLCDTKETQPELRLSLGHQAPPHQLAVSIRHTHTCTHTHVCTHIYTYTCTCILTHTHMHACMNTHTICKRPCHLVSPRQPWHEGFGKLQSRIRESTGTGGPKGSPGWRPGPGRTTGHWQHSGRDVRPPDTSQYLGGPPALPGRATNPAARQGGRRWLLLSSDGRAGPDQGRVTNQ